MCQLEGSDHGGRDSAAELALAGTVDVQMSDDSYNRLTLGSVPPDGSKLYSSELFSQRFLKEASQGGVSARKSIGFMVTATEPLTTVRGFHPSSGE